MSSELIHCDRRVDRRYACELQTVFSYTDAHGEVRVGCGVTLDLSRGGARFSALEPPPVGASTEARIAWPFKLQGTLPLELVVRGQIISSGERGAVLEISSYEFRSCGPGSFSECLEVPSFSQVA